MRRRERRFLRTIKRCARAPRPGVFYDSLQELKSAVDEIGQGHLGQEYQREADGELLVLGLVVENAHAQQGADAAAEHGKQDQRRLRDAPFALPGLPLVEAIGQEGQEVDSDQIIDYNHACKNKNLFVYFALDSIIICIEKEIIIPFL